MVDKISLLVLGQVESVENGDNDVFGQGADAWRIKVRLESDGGKTVEELPEAFPLLPKTLQSIPKVGEAVFILTAELENFGSQRFYIGPVISQPQFQGQCNFSTNNRNEQNKLNKGPAVSLITTGGKGKDKPLPSITTQRGLTDGAFPNKSDVALIGRGQEDIVLKYRKGHTSGIVASEVDIRAGIRLKATDNTVRATQGNVVFNNANPAYIQVKHSQSGLAGLNEVENDSIKNKFENQKIRSANSVVNVVADKINLISHKDNAQFGENIKDRDELILANKMDEIMSKLHRSVYGDELITLLQLIVDGLRLHTHKYPMLPPTVTGTVLEDLIGYNYEKILSPNVRIS